METKSIEKIQTAHPKLKAKMLAAYQEAVKVTPTGVHPYIDEVLRTFKRSDELYAQGRTKPGPIVTNAPGGSSYHNYGLACDFHIQVNGKDIWPNRPDKDNNWMKVVTIFKKYGFKWGADWDNDGITKAQGDKDEGIVDAPHFEQSFGYSVKQLLALYKAGKVDKDGYVLI